MWVTYNKSKYGAYTYEEVRNLRTSYTALLVICMVGLAFVPYLYTQLWMWVIHVLLLFLLADRALFWTDQFVRVSYASSNKTYKWNLGDGTSTYLFNTTNVDAVANDLIENEGYYLIKKEEACYLINKTGEMLMSDTEVPVLLVFDNKDVATDYLKKNHDKFDDGDYYVVPFKMKEVDSGDTTN